MPTSAPVLGANANAKLIWCLHGSAVPTQESGLGAYNPAVLAENQALLQPLASAAEAAVKAKGRGSRKGDNGGDRRPALPLGMLQNASCVIQICKVFFPFCYCIASIVCLCNPISSITQHSCSIHMVAEGRHAVRWSHSCLQALLLRLHLPRMPPMHSLVRAHRSSYLHLCHTCTAPHLPSATEVYRLGQQLL
jgi:hypothetical protein